VEAEAQMETEMKTARQVALTFDAEHPDRPVDSLAGCTLVLDALAAGGVPATFFVQGRWALARPAEARRIATDGHLVGLHCGACTCAEPASLAG
jgi:peptidoglycan/xylan/chitin deacetylase (PgdA/CDA1 family)